MNFKQYFEELKTIQKIEIYLIVLMIYGSSVYFYDDIFSSGSNNFDTKTLSQYKKKTVQLNSKITQKDDLYILKLIEDKSEELDIFINKLNINKNKINIQCEGKFQHIISLLKFIQQHFYILDFVFTKINKTIKIDLNIDIQYLFNPNKIDHKQLTTSNPFDLIKEKQFVEKIKYNDIKVLAIVMDEVLIQNKWYKTDAIVCNCKIVAIHSNSITVVNLETKQFNTIKLKRKI